jgi:uncharacterized protein (UPF0333 family)
LNNKGQFSIIAALLVAVVLIATVIVTYSTIRNSPIQRQPQVLSAIDETNLAIKQVLGFTIGYYGSVLRVTGNSTYAKILALAYLRSGLENIANMHPEWGASFNESSSDLYTYWFTNASYSRGNLGITYNLTGLGIYGITYAASCKLNVQIMNTTSPTQAYLNVTKDEDEPLINLGRQEFKFYRYVNTSSTWELTSPSNEPVGFANGTYLIDLPSGIDPYSYLIQVEDPRGIIVVASSFSLYTCMLTWNSTLYSSQRDATLVAELLQNGTMRWLGQSLQLTTNAKPVPPIPVKALHVNQTINGINCEVPFQVEDWTSEYRIPLGLTNNASVFNSRTMLVFLANKNVSKVTIWWNGSDAATQTPYAFVNRYFTGDNPSSGVLTNGILRLQFGSGFTLTSTVGSFSATANFMRINSDPSEYGSSLAYVITWGVIRDIIHQEAEWSDGANNCPNLYAHIILTLPANATYYTYQLRLMFVDSSQTRTITDLCPIRLTSLTGTPQTENGTASGYPIVSNGTGTFYNLSSSLWAHHWSQFISGSRGAGIMFTDIGNQMLYFFDAIAGNKTGAVKPDSSQGRIEMLPVTMAQVKFTYALDVIWHGAIVTFDGTTPIYKEESGNKTGLWIIVEYPPTIATSTES